MEIDALMHSAIAVMVETVSEILTDRNPSIYLYGSVVLADFRPGWSDIDILVLTDAPISVQQSRTLLTLRQVLSGKYMENPYFRLFEGAMLSLRALLNQEQDNVVYWGTSGQSLKSTYQVDVFSKMILLDHGMLMHGEEIRGQIEYPARAEQLKAIRAMHHAVTEHAVIAERSLYSAGWLLDISRCLYTLQTGKVIAKTQAARWAIGRDLIPDAAVLQRAISVREDPISHVINEATLEWLAGLGPCIQEYARVLEAMLNKETSVSRP